MLRAIDKNIWVAEQPLRYFGLSVGTRMTVIRLTDRELAVISPIQIDASTIEQLDAIGKVSHIVAPNLYHYLFLSEFKAIYPNATVWAAPGLDAKKRELPIDRIIERSIDRFLPGVEALQFEGFRTVSLTGFDALNECVFLHGESRTLILTDTAFHFDRSFPFITQLATRIMGGYHSLSPSLLEWLATQDKESVKQSVQQVLAWDFDRVIMAHGSIVETDGKQKFRTGYEQFLGKSLHAIA
jgi:glyoxylase-like metal-dependent hydrolase (beta-lactamase superfamily II)